MTKSSKVLIVFCLSVAVLFLCIRLMKKSPALMYDRRKTLLPKSMYVPAPLEQRILQDSEFFNLDEKSDPNKVSGCRMWSENSGDPVLSQMLKEFLADLEEYQAVVENFSLSSAQNVKNRFKTDEKSDADFCASLRLGKDGKLGTFKSGQVSVGRLGFLEPLFPPMRSPRFCFDYSKLLSLDYLVHDFEAMCRDLKVNSRIIFIDLGASLNFHGNDLQPAFQLLALYKKFGFIFDHIYAFEAKYSSSLEVYSMLPEDMIPSFHWMNFPVSSELESRLNPWRSILSKYNEDDLIIVKVDIDSPELESNLVNQILNDNDLAKLVDHLYFEHHVTMAELSEAWGEVTGSIKESLQLFTNLRQSGISAHFWV